jgi:predicted dehydrogenase
MREIGIGLIGAGYIGHTIALAYRGVAAVFPHVMRPHLMAVADVSEDSARRAAQRYGFARATGDWRELLADPEIEIVAIAAPNHLHHEMAHEALAAKKHVHCEKPLARIAQDAAFLATAAERVKTTTIVGYNYLHNPMIAAAREIVTSGEIGHPVHFRGTHNEDYLADPDLPFSWRCDAALAGAGALADVGSHIVSLAMTLMGDIAEVCGDVATVVKERRAPDGTRRAVENDDQAQALLRFASGATGTLEASRIAQGQKMGLGFELTGTKGAIVFDQTRLNELRLYRADAAKGRHGFTTILAGPEHPGYAAFCQGPGHQIGFNDLKVIEVARFLEAIAGGHPAYPDFAAAAKFERVTAAVLRSAEERRWANVDAMPRL